MNIVEELTQKTLEMYSDKEIIKKEFSSEIHFCAINIAEFVIENVKDKSGEDDYYSEYNESLISEIEEEVFHEVEMCINSLDMVYIINYPEEIIEQIRKNIINVMIKNSAKELGYSDEDCTKEVMSEVESNLISSSYPNNYYGKIMDWFYADISESGQLLTV